MVPPKSVGGEEEVEEEEEEEGPTFVLDVEEPLLPEAAERGDAGAGADEDAGHLRVLGQVEAGGAAHTKDPLKHKHGAPCSLPPPARSRLRHLGDREG